MIILRVSLEPNKIIIIGEQVGARARWEAESLQTRGHSVSSNLEEPRGTVYQSRRSEPESKKAEDGSRNSRYVYE